MKSANWQSRHIVVPAVYVLLRRNQEVLLLKRHNTGYRDGYYSLPAGHLDGGEPAVDAAARELKEEVGVDINPKNLKLVHTQHRVAEEGNHERLNLFFELTSWDGEPQNLELEKSSEIRWVSMNNLPDNMVPELKHMFKHLLAKENYGHFGF
jgi:8-oxo-dGTP diphosphatase